MKILVVGSGGREHAMVWALRKSPDNVVYCAPGNAGIAERATCIPVKATDIDQLVIFAKAEGIDLTIVGPEAPLVAGIVDRFREAGLLICGPSKAAARTEGSKEWFKDFLVRHNLPTAPFEVFTDLEEALAYIQERDSENIVIKADGLVGGKGVILPKSVEESEVSLRELLSRGVVVIEDRLFGNELSAMALVDRETVVMLPYTRDYKRVGDGDTGPNTGGMGAHTIELPEETKRELERILRAVVKALADEECPYTGFIYIGFIMTENGPIILECNCRLGDPEAQVILPSIEGDFAGSCLATAHGELTNVPAPVQTKQAVCVVLTSGPYPEPSDRDDAIVGISDAEEAGALVFHAGTGKRGKFFTTNKQGRVLTITGVGESFEEARVLAYDGSYHIDFYNKKYRRDIGRGVI